MGAYFAQYAHFLGRDAANKAAAEAGKEPAVHPSAVAYGVQRYGEESRRLLSVLELHLKEELTTTTKPGRRREYIVDGAGYTIADIAACPFVMMFTEGAFGKMTGIDAKADYPFVHKGAHRCSSRPAYQAGLQVASKDPISKL